MRIAAAGFVAVALLASCVSGSSGAEVPVSIEQRLQFSGDGAEANFAYMEEATRVCMAEAGFDYRPKTVTMAEFVPYPTIGSWSVERANEYGLSVVTSIRGTFDDNKIEGTNQEVLDTLGSLEEKNLWIDTSAKCSAEVGQELNGAWFSEMDVIRPQYEDMVHRFIADGRHQDLQREWSACFSDAGFGAHESLDDLIVSQQNLVDRLDRLDDDVIAKAEDDERRLAVGAATCAEPLREDWQQIWDEYEAEFNSRVQIPAFPVPDQ